MCWNFPTLLGLIPTCGFLCRTHLGMDRQRDMVPPRWLAMVPMGIRQASLTDPNIELQSRLTRVASQAAMQLLTAVVLHQLTMPGPLTVGFPSLLRSGTAIPKNLDGTHRIHTSWNLPSTPSLMIQHGGSVVLDPLARTSQCQTMLLRDRPAAGPYPA